MKKVCYILALLLLFPAVLSAQNDTSVVQKPIEIEFELVDEDETLEEAPLSEPSKSTKYQDRHFDEFYLDTVQVSRQSAINDYSMLGVQYGAGLSYVYWNPSVSQSMVCIPYNVGVMYTRYGKMFGYMPYFGIQVGVFYTKEAWKYKGDEDYTPYVTGTGESAAQMTVIEVPVLAHLHVDFWKMKIIANVGFFGGYRLDIQRSGPSLKEEFETSFADYNNRIDWGLKGGVGIGFVFDPIEIHIQGTYKHSFSSLYLPDYNSSEYYRYAYPANIIISVGLHVQLTKRTGKTSKQLKQEARDAVYTQ